MSETKIIIVSGKGGVGKTTIACATAVAAADAGQRTLVVSLDRAHSLGDVLGVTLNSDATRVPGCENLEAMEMDPQNELAKNGTILKGYMERLFSYLGVKGATVQEMAVFPGLEELLLLSHLMDLAASGKYDLIVTDMAPTASSLRYLSFPDMMEGVFGKLLLWDQRLSQFLRPFQGKHLQLPVPENEVYDSVRHFASTLSRLKDILQDPKRTVVRLVMVPESIVLEETRRAFTYFCLFGLTVDAVIVNRILPNDVVNGYFAKWHEVQSRILNQAKESLADLPLLQLEFQREEVLEVESLRRLATVLNDQTVLGKLGDVTPPMTYSREGENTVLTLRLPNARPDGLDLRLGNGELTVTVDGWRRKVALPDFLSGHTVTKARFSDGKLAVRFGASTPKG